MLLGPDAPNKLPEQNIERVMLCAEQFQYASQAQEGWATRAKQAVDFLEGKQWTAQELAEMEMQGRPALTFNKIAPLYRLISGYHTNNRTDTRFLPGHDGTGTKEIGETITRIFKSMAELNQLSFIDQEVFLDGIATGRGYWDARLDFDDNIFGELKFRAVDPFSVYVDPQCQTYDFNDRNGGAGYVCESRWVSIDEIEYTYGKAIAKHLRPYVGSGTIWNGFNSIINDAGEEIKPETSFGEFENEGLGLREAGFGNTFADSMIDTARKNIRVIDRQYYVNQMRKVFVDLETGDSKPIPDHWDNQKVEKCLYWAEQHGNPLRVISKKMRRIRWVVLVGDILIHDDWSPYETYTLNGYFPYFRRGKTRGALEDLIDPQTEINKRRSLTIEIVSRNAKGGWKVPVGSLKPKERANLEDNGAKPGVVVEFDPKKGEPKEIGIGQSPVSMERLEAKATEDLNQITGINEAAMGQLDQVQSGRALEARQRQAVISIQMYMDNFSRSKELQGRKALNIFQNFYTEERVVRTLGEDGKFVQDLLNKQEFDPVSGNPLGKLNDITLGKYSVAIDETPLSSSFLNGQFEETLTIIEKLSPVLGPNIGVLSDILIDISSLPRKDEIKQRLSEVLGTSTAITSGTVPPGTEAGMLPQGMPAQ